MYIKKKRNALAVLVLILLVLVSLGIAQLISLGNVEKNVMRRALDEVKKSTFITAENFNHSISMQFDLLETLANHLGTQKSLDTVDCTQLMRSFLTENKFCTVAYTNRNGDILNAVSAEGVEPSGNISDRHYFQSAVYWKDARAIEYMNKTALTDSPRVLLAVPIISHDSVVGCLFASTEQDFFESKVFSSRNYDSVNVFLMDKEGIIIADPANKGLFQNGYNIFESFLSKADVEIIKRDLSISNNNTIIIEGVQSGCLSYCKTAYNDWQMVGFIDHSSAIEKYAENVRAVNQQVLLISAIFVVCMFVFCIIWLLLEKQKNKTVKELEGTNKNLYYFLEKSGNASFFFNAKKVDLQPSKALEEMLGSEIPHNWLSITDERQKLHPEFDYDGIIRVFNEVVSKKEYREICTCYKKPGGELKWLKFSMAPALDNGNNYSGVVGIVTDITDDYTARELNGQEQSYISKALITYLPLTVSVNLTQGTYTIINHDPSFCAELPQNGFYDDFISFIAARVPGETSDMYIKTFDKERLLTDHEQSSDDIEFEHPFIDCSEKPEKWLIDKIHFLPNKINTDVRLLFIVVDITQRKEFESVLQQKYNQIIEPESISKNPFDVNEGDHETTNAKNASVEIRTFGYFDLFVNGHPIPFANEKAKEMLAILVDRKGGFVSSSEMISYLWEDEPADKRTLARCRQVASRLNKTLEDNGIGDIVENVSGKRRIRTDKVDCDYYKYLSNKIEYRCLFNGSYMMNYSWGEMTLAELESDRDNKK